MFSIRIATPEDIPLIRELAAQTWEETYKDIHKEGQSEYMFKMMYSEEVLYQQMVDEGQMFFIACLEDIPTGYLAIEKTSEKTFILQKIYIIPFMQGKGLGEFMIDQGIAYLKQHYSTPFDVTLNVNRANPAVNFYKHIGFEIVDVRDRYIGNGFYMNDYVMRLPICNKGTTR